MFNLETSLAAAVATIPTRQKTAQTIGAKLGVSAMDAGLCAKRTRRRSFAEADGATTAAALVTRLPRNGEAIHWLLDGNFRLADVIPVIQAHIGAPASLTICTLGLNNDTTDLLAAMLQDGRLTGLRLAMSSYFKASDPETATHAVQALTAVGAVVAVARLHAKLQLWRPATGPARFVLETSSNLRSCQCVEVASLTNDARLYRWHCQWLTKFFNRQAANL